MSYLADSFACTTAISLEYMLLCRAIKRTEVVARGLSSRPLPLKTLAEHGHPELSART